MTILEALHWAQDQIKSTAGEKIDAKPNPMLDAQILLAHSLGKSTAYLFGHFDDPLNAHVIDKFQRLVNQRVRHEPVAYITGRKAFYGRDFFVNPLVLIPRPETELMIEIALQLIDPESLTIDVGTGSGTIAVTLAAESQQPILATEIAASTLDVARTNARDHGVDHLVSFLHGNLLDPILATNLDASRTSPRAIICANLPYIRIARWPLLDPDVRDFEPKGALVGGVDGLDVYDELLQQIQTHRGQFPTELALLIEIDPSQELSAPALIREHFPSALIETKKDLSGKVRLVVARI